MILIVIKASEKRYCMKNHLKIFYLKEETEHKAENRSTLSTRQFKRSHRFILFHLSWKNCTSMHVCGLGYTPRA